MNQEELDRKIEPESTEGRRLADYRARITEYYHLHGQRAEMLARREDNFADLLQGRTPEEEQQLVEWEKQLSSLALNEFEERDLKRLDARERRPEQLRQAEEGWRAESFQVLTPVEIDESLQTADGSLLQEAIDSILQKQRDKNSYPKYNLPGRIAQYEENKELTVLYPADLPEFAREVQDQVRRDLKELEALAARRWPDDTEMAKKWKEVMKDMLKQFAQHVAKDLSGPTTDSLSELANTSPSAVEQMAVTEVNPFAPLLLKYTLTELTELLGELGLLDTGTGRPTLAASPGAWVGVVHALLHPDRPRLRSNMAAVGRALKEVFHARVSESALQAGISKRGSESEQFRDRTLALLAASAAGD